MNPIFYVVSSAALYAASFLWVPFFWWMLFFFLMPLFFVLQFYRLSFWHGFLWGCISYSLLLSAVWLVSIEYGTGWFRYGAPGLLVIWFALWSGVWFLLLGITCSYNGYAKIFLQISITTFYFMGIHNGVLWPFFCRMEGYPFTYPLIPLMYVVSPLLLSLVHKAGALFIVVAIQVCFVQITRYVLLAIVFFFISGPQEKEDWKNDIVCSAQRWQCTQPYERAQEICHHLITVKEQWPEKKVIVLPESTFPFILSEHVYAMTMWTDNVLHNDTYLILGTYRREGAKLFNSFLIIHQGRIIYYYDKKHLITFFEQNHFKTKLFKKGNSLFLLKKEPFSVGSSAPIPFTLTGSDQLFPLICSESFWAMPSQARAIALINDSYFRLDYFPLTMRLLAYMNALEAKTDLLYCSLWSSTVYKNKLKGLFYKIKKPNTCNKIFQIV